MRLRNRQKVSEDRDRSGATYPHTSSDAPLIDIQRESAMNARPDFDNLIRFFYS